MSGDLGEPGSSWKHYEKLILKLLKWLVWSSDLGRCVVAVEAQVRTLRLAHYSNFLNYFLIVHYILTCGPDFAKTKKFSQHSISSQNILFTSKSILLYTQEIIIVKGWLLATSSLCVESNIYSHLFYQIVFVAWVLLRR